MSDAAFRSAERAYLEPPDDRFPPGVEDAMDTVVMFPDDWEPGDDPLLHEIWTFGIVDGWDEDGDLVIVDLLDHRRRTTIRLAHLDEYLVPAGPLQKLADLANKISVDEHNIRERRRAFVNMPPFIRYELQRGSV